MMKTVIIDDEPRAIQLLEKYISRFSDLQVEATFRNGLKALEYLNNNPVEAIFLDINMPQFSGLSLSKLLPPQIKVIFTTAYSEYAVESYEVNAVDYLLKPISFERFTKAVNKLLIGTERPSNPFQQPFSSTTQEDLYLKDGTRLFKVAADAIHYLEKDGNYMYYHTADKKIVTRQTVQEALNLLPEYFLQVHKSFIIPLSKIEFIDTHEVKVPGRVIPLGSQYKKQLTERVEQARK